MIPIHEEYIAEENQSKHWKSRVKKMLKEQHPSAVNVNLDPEVQDESRFAQKAVKRSPLASVAKSSNLGVESHQNELSHISLMLPQHIRINWKPR